jgi:oligopeptide/dipeptide ABC transporter ATP-binding protein
MGAESLAPILELVDVSLEYIRGPVWNRDPLRAVRGVSLKIAKGETLGLVGESGSGKTSVGRLALGMVKPTTGSVLFLGEKRARDRKRNRGRRQVVLQNPDWSLNPRVRCGTSVLEPLVILGVLGRAQRQAALAEMLELVGLERQVADRYPHELSGGQRQRVAIARALITSPTFIVFDEVVSALDVSIQAQILNLIKSLQAERGFAALFISHELAAVRYVSHTVAVMYGGEIAEMAASEDLYTVSAHPYTRALQAAAGGDATAYQLKEVPDLPQAGCLLAPRCPMAIPKCSQVHPDLRQVGNGLVACHRAEEVRALGDQRSASGFARTNRSA